MKNISFKKYYDRIISELKTDSNRNNSYFDTLNMLVNLIINNGNFTELEKIERLKGLIYTNKSLSKEKLENIDKELGLDKYYEESIR